MEGSEVELVLAQVEVEIAVSAAAEDEEGRLPVRPIERGVARGWSAYPGPDWTSLLPGRVDIGPWTSSDFRGAGIVPVQLTPKSSLIVKSGQSSSPPSLLVHSWIACCKKF